jgi:hypothetical protein
MEVEVRTFGPLDVLIDGIDQPVTGRLVRRLFARLLLAQPNTCAILRVLLRRRLGSSLSPISKRTELARVNNKTNPWRCLDELRNGSSVVVLSGEEGNATE